MLTFTTWRPLNRETPLNYLQPRAVYENTRRNAFYAFVPRIIEYPMWKGLAACVVSEETVVCVEMKTVEAPKIINSL